MSQSSNTEDYTAFPKIIKNCPVLDVNECTLVGKCEFDFHEKFYMLFQEFLYQNPGKTTEELCQIITFYTFTPETLEIAFKMFNTWKNTFYGICGPFIYKNDRWFPVYAKKYSDAIILARENSKLRQKIEELEKQLDRFKTDNVKIASN